MLKTNTQKYFSLSLIHRLGAPAFAPGPSGAETNPLLTQWLIITKCRNIIGAWATTQSPFPSRGVCPSQCTILLPLAFLLIQSILSTWLPVGYVQEEEWKVLLAMPNQWLVVRALCWEVGKVYSNASGGKRPSTVHHISWANALYTRMVDQKRMVTLLCTTYIELLAFPGGVGWKKYINWPQVPLMRLTYLFKRWGEFKSMKLLIYQDMLEEEFDLLHCCTFWIKLLPYSF